MTLPPLLSIVLKTDWAGLYLAGTNCIQRQFDIPSAKDVASSIANKGRCVEKIGPEIDDFRNQRLALPVKDLFKINTFSR